MPVNIIIDGSRKNTSTILYERYYQKGKYKMIKHYIEKANFEDTGFSYALSLISGKQMSQVTEVRGNTMHGLPPSPLSESAGAKQLSWINSSFSKRVCVFESNVVK